MAKPKLPPALRDAIVREFRRRAFDRIGLKCFLDQARWQCATEGYRVTDTVLTGAAVTSVSSVPRIELTLTDPKDPFTIRTEWRLLEPLPFGCVHNAALLCAYKYGKSHTVAAWATGFAAIGRPHASHNIMVGYEYGSSENEWDYLCEFLCSRSGLGLGYVKKANNVKQGAMYLQLKNDAYFEAKSWANKEDLKGDEITTYMWNEAFQLPGLDTFNAVSQNLRALKGFSVWTSTCDAPWLKELHELGHGFDEDWLCVCGVPGWCNPFSLDVRALTRDCPDAALLEPYVPMYPWMRNVVDYIAKQRAAGRPGIQTTERFLISWLGKLGTFAGGVYKFQQGDRVFSPATHPNLWSKKALQEADEDAKLRAEVESFLKGQGLGVTKTIMEVGGHDGADTEA